MSLFFIREIRTSLRRDVSSLRIIPSLILSSGVGEYIETYTESLTTARPEIIRRWQTYKNYTGLRRRLRIAEEVCFAYSSLFLKYFIQMFIQLYV